MVKFQAGWFEPYLGNKPGGQAFFPDVQKTLYKPQKIGSKTFILTKTGQNKLSGC